MSQIFADSGGSPLADVETLTTDESAGGGGPVVVPADGANNINVLAITSEEFNALEIQTVGNVATNTVTVTQFNTLLGSATGTGATTINLITFDLGATDAVYVMDITMTIFDDTNNEGAGCNIFGTIRTIAGVATIIGTPDVVINEDAGLVTSVCRMDASGNNFILEFDVPAGITVRTSAFCHYTKQE